MNEMHGQRTRQDLLWDLCSGIEHDPQIASLLTDLDERMRKRRRRFRALRAPLMGAAALALIAAITFVLWPAAAPVAEEYVTRAGEQRVVDLSDGSRLTLNTATRLRVSYDKKLRSVELLAGEVLCAVRKDAGRPFEVRANGGLTSAVGTEFAVQIAQGETFVAVLEGTVAVTAEAAKRHGNAAATFVRAGEAITYLARASSTHPARADLQRIRAWAEHRIVFDDVTLQRALADYNRYTTTPIRLANIEYAGKRIYGNFAIGDEAAFLGALSEMLPLMAARANGEIVLEAAPHICRNKCR